MNFLAHAFLSFDDPDFLTGNMISDFVKGKKKFDYPFSIQKGIELHRAIDEFTDFHSVTAKAKEFFRPHYRLYSGPFIDIVFDHFLALDDAQFLENKGLKNFTETTYSRLKNNASYFPLPFQKMFPYMQSQNWLYGYRFKEGINKSFGGLVRRASYLNESETAFKIFNKNYDRLQEFYSAFFPELKEFAFKKMQQLRAE
ncbi:MAG TPA: ACP phosphodiesterase [Hanamia sp.]|nr:ACP phosphodiesterase [Hanamia sp.]